MILNLEHSLAKVAMSLALLLGASMAAPNAAHANHGSYNNSAAARVSVDLNIRYGPSIDYYVVDVIPRGRNVSIQRCLPRRDWCEVRYRGRTGWVYSQYLYHPRYNRSYDRWDNNDFVIAFDFFANIFDHDRDRRHRYHRDQWSDDYYRNVRHHGRRGHDDWSRRHRDHDRHDRDRYDRDRDYRDHADRYDRDHRYDRDRHDRDRYDWDGRRGR